MASPNMQIERSGRARVADRVTNKVADALKSDKAFESGSLALSARIAGTAAAAVLDLPADARQALTRRQAELMRQQFEAQGNAIAPLIIQALVIAALIFVFAILGGLLGIPIFEKRKGAPPPPPSFNAGGEPGGYAA